MRRLRVLVAATMALAVYAAMDGAASAAVNWSVTSSISDGATLTGFPQWSATIVGNPPGGIDHVDFSVDGKVLWTEHNAPYFFNDDFYPFSPWVLGKGTHALAVNGVSKNGELASATANVTVPSAGPTVPRALRGKFTRRVTAKDLARYPSPDVPLLPGTYTLQIARNGLIHATGASGGSWNTFASVTRTAFRTGPPAQWLGVANERGTICKPEHTFTRYRWAKVRGGVRFTARGADSCSDRQAVLQGKWRRR